jgi:hypothetical protein
MRDGRGGYFPDVPSLAELLDTAPSAFETAERDAQGRAINRYRPWTPESISAPPAANTTATA